MSRANGKRCQEHEWTPWALHTFTPGKRQVWRSNCRICGWKQTRVVWGEEERLGSFIVAPDDRLVPEPRT